MLEFDYSGQVDQLISSAVWDIELPIEWSDYFSERGEVCTFPDDTRLNQRLKIRTHALLWFESTLPFCPRSTDPLGVYTRDFSKQGAGFLTPFELYPDEELRIVLRTFWVELTVCRVRRITSKCYEIGAALIERHDPSPKAFERLNDAAAL